MSDLVRTGTVKDGRQTGLGRIDANDTNGYKYDIWNIR